MSEDSMFCHCLLFSVNSLSRKLTAMAEKEFKVTGLSSSLGFVLMQLNKKPGLLASDLSKAVQLNPSTVTRLVDKLEREGFLYRHVEGKYVRIYPQKKSLSLDKDLRKAWKKVFENYVAVLGQDSAQELVEAVNNASAALS